MSDTVKKHHWLTANRILFRDNDQEAAANVDVNALVTTNKKEIRVKDIAKIQQSAQMNLFQRLGGPVEVMNLTIIGINYLGAMSTEEFNNATPVDLGANDDQTTKVN